MGRTAALMPTCPASASFAPMFTVLSTSSVRASIISKTRSPLVASSAGSSVSL